MILEECQDKRPRSVCSENELRQIERMSSSPLGVARAHGRAKLDVSEIDFMASNFVADSSLVVKFQIGAVFLQQDNQNYCFVSMH